MIVVLSAMECECTELNRALEGRTEVGTPFGIFFRGTLFDNSVVLGRSGIGKALAAGATQFLIDTFKPAYLVFTGIAGALNPEFEIGDVVIGDELLQHDLDTSPLGFGRGQIPYSDLRVVNSDRDLVRIALGCVLPGHRVHSGRILSGDQFLTHADKVSHSYLVDELEGDAVEMEGAAVALVAHLNRTPALIVRTISDRADDEATQDFTRFLPVASANSSQIVRHVLSSLRSLES